jgi:hypothetical protein
MTQGEKAPVGRQWLADLIQRARRAADNRPVILPAILADAADRTRKFRHVAVRAYDNFGPDDAEPAVRAAEKVAAGLVNAIAAYRRAIDPLADHAAFASIRCAISVSAICTAFSAAPLRRLSDTHQNDSPFATVGSLRMRLT